MNTALRAHFSPLPLLLVAALTAGSAWAENPEWAGQGKGGKHAQKENRSDKRNDDRRDGGHREAQVRVAPVQISIGGYFGAQQRMAVRAPPAGHKYMRVAADILRIAVGSGRIVDAIQDLDRA
jgi:hypothetical protein